MMLRAIDWPEVAIRSAVLAMLCSAAFGAFLIVSIFAHLMGINPQAMIGLFQ